MKLPDSTTVIICGAGPTGLTLANLLGAEGIDTLLVERNPGCVPEPRAVALDGESMRTLQAAGLAEEVRQSLREGIFADYINAEGVELFTADLTARPYGFCLQNSFDQPTLERQLLAGLSRFACVSVCHNTELLEFTQDETGVSATLQCSNAGLRYVRADYLVASDGGRSPIRQALGIAMQGERLPQKWLVIDTVDKYLGAEPVCRFFCDPARPAMTISRPGGERRWEWMLVQNEVDADLLDDTRIKSLLAAHTDTEQVQIYRKCVYSFSAVVAERFSQGRVFLAGDAAHMTPPFAGQGLNAGIRDARNLSWKLAAVARGELPQALLDSYDFERRDAARTLIDMAVELGDRIQPTDPALAAERDAFFAALNADAEAAAGFRADMLAPLSDVRLPQGWFDSNGCGGRLLPQPEVLTGTGCRLLDELLGPGFVALLQGMEEVPPALASHPLWRRLRPTVHLVGRGHFTLDEPFLSDFLGDAGAGITLLRPDRFVLAHLASDGSANTVLDALMGRLEPDAPGGVVSVTA